ncbi:hypothetical protein TNCV_2412951 [Trichonephila clavipes]|nr:hypothetical protein TNCV_2412951 [Trichonephila clavipes]
MRQLTLKSFKKALLKEMARQKKKELMFQKTILIPSVIHDKAYKKYVNWNGGIETEDVGLPEKKRACNPRKNIALTSKEIESSSSPNKISKSQEKSKSSKNEVIYPKYPMTRIPYHTNQFAHRQQYGGWNWRNDQSQHPDTITNTRYKVYSPQFPSPYRGRGSRVV